MVTYVSMFSYTILSIVLTGEFDQTENKEDLKTKYPVFNQENIDILKNNTKEELIELCLFTLSIINPYIKKRPEFLLPIDEVVTNAFTLLIA
jgi:hypothetical protein